MAEQGFQEKSEKATPRQAEKARDEGRVTKSNDLNAAVMVCLGFASLLAMGPYMVRNLKMMLHHTMTNAPQIALEDPTFVKVFGDSLVRFFTIMAPIFVLLVVIGALVNIAQVGFKITPKALKPKFDKFDLVKGLKQKLSVRSLVIAVRDTAKLGIVGFVAYKALEAEFEDFFLLPDMDAGCSLAASITGADVRRLREQHPGVPVVTYVNAYADVRAEADICCTSGNAVKVVESLGTDRVIFIPDGYLGRYVAQQTDVEITTEPSTELSEEGNSDAT